MGSPDSPSYTVAPEKVTASKGNHTMTALRGPRAKAYGAVAVLGHRVNPIVESV